MHDYTEHPIFITGLPRSGTSMTAGIFAQLGVFTGPTVPGGLSNPKGFFENTIIREEIIKGILNAANFCPLGVSSLPPIDFNEEINFDKKLSLKDILQRIILAQGYNKEVPWLYKDAKLTLLWRIFNSQFPNALWIIVRRDRENVIRSCLSTHFMLQHSSKVDFWNKFADEYETRLEALLHCVKNVIQINTDELVNGHYEIIENICRDRGINFVHSVVNDFVSPVHWNRGNP